MDTSVGIQPFHNLVITPEILRLIAELDEFKGRWQALGQLAPDKLSSLRRVATIESIGSSTRIEGSRLSDEQVERLLSGVTIHSFGSRDEQFDGTVELSAARFLTDVWLTEVALERAPAGFLLVTYCGFGGRVPGNYELIRSEGICADWLRVWRKTRERAGGRWYVDQGEAVRFMEARRRRPESLLLPIPSGSDT